MEEKYDAIVLGTGLKEGIISALLSVHGKKVLHMDRNNYYGGDCATIKLTDLYKMFGEDPATIPQNMGRDADWNIDLVPKFILSGGDLMRMLRHADCLMYLDFGRVAGHFVLYKDNIHRVPCTVKEALASKLMGIFEKKRMADLLQSINDYFDPDKKKPMKMDPKKNTVKEFFAEYGLDDETRDFIVHAMSLATNMDCLNKPAYETFEKINLYTYSLALYGASPFIYPMYGLGDLPQAFARLAAVWGGTYMLDRKIDEILYDENGKVAGIRSGTEKAYAPLVIGDPSYFPEYVSEVGKVGRGIVILKSPLEQCAKQSEVETDKAGNKVFATSAQIIVTGIAAKNGREEDIYITTQGYQHRTTPKGLQLGFISGTVKTDNEAELEPGWKILSGAGILKKFYKVTKMYEPRINECEPKGIFISKSYDATSHFESTVADAIAMYERITGEKLDLDSKIVRPAIPGMELVDQQ
ncbi:Rab_GDP dissociation inhibitor [Hexamita inflata]|uniref:Rab GDP dissociation inhibitor n=1 Tax=Hexamita inflata TaxID=28002 RepID=A0AA86U3G7_9EUKA|nr:Rab GDP dissociation inhibitor [Hexamita inflata]